MADDTDQDLLALTADIVAAHVSNNNVGVGDLPGLIAQVHGALAGLGQPAAAPQPELKPAIGVRASVKPDFIVCLEDGKKMKMLKRHLMTDHGLTPADYRARWSLPADYPMVAPNYAEARRGLAMKIGLGRKRAAAPPAASAKAPAKRAPARRAPARRAPRKPEAPAS